MRLCSWLLVLFACSLRLSLAEPATAKPSWAGEAIFYQIFPERFCNGDPKNDPTRDSLEWPIKPGPSWRISSWTADWYARDQWEKELGPGFYDDGVFDRRYGGDLKGALDKLDYLQDLGVNALYFNPLFYSRSLHKYDGNSYHHIDPYFGPDPKGDLAAIEKETADPKTWQWTAADKLFLELVKQAHARGMHVIIDGVFNHTGRDFFAFKDLRKNQEKSPYKDWYVVESFDDPQTKRVEFSYKGWFGVKTLPVFAASADGKNMHPGPKGYVFEATKRWMRPNGKQEDGIDGWRLDVAEQRPAKFWADWNALVREMNPNAYTSAELWQSAAEMIRNGGFSASMNYHAFAIPTKGFVIDGKLPPSKYAELLETRRQELPPENAAVMQNMIDSHDTDRLASMIVNSPGSAPYGDPANFDFNRNDSARMSQTYDIRKPSPQQRNIQRLVAFMQMTYVGAPMIYYGDEASMWGGTDPDDRMPMVWKELKFDPQAIDPRGRKREPDDVNFDADLFGSYKKVIALRREHDALNHGDFKIVATDDKQRVLVMGRHSAKESLLVALNRGEEPAQISIDTKDGKLTTIFVTQGETDAVKVTNADGKAAITLPALTGAVFEAK